MNVLELLTQLRRAGIQLSLDGEKLKIKAPQGAMTDAIKSQLKEQKEQIVEFLRESQGQDSKTDFEIVDRSGLLPLSYTQQALWTMYKLAPASIAYNLPMAFRFTGDLDANLLNRAISAIIARHESLRSRFLEDDNGVPYVAIEPVAPFNIAIHGLNLESEIADEEIIRKAVYHLTQQPFDLEQGPLYRFDLIKLSGAGEGQFVLAICLHHIIADGLSLNLLIRELALLYASCLRDMPAPLAPLPVQYVDFANWQKQRFSGVALEQEISFWRKQMAGVPSLLALPTDRSRPPVQTTNGSRYFFTIADSLSEQLNAYCQAQGMTLFMGLMAALQVVLSRHANQTDFCIGMPTAGRNQKEVEQLIGFFVNGVLVRADLNGNPTWNEHVQRVRQRLLDVFAHQDTPAQVIIDHLDVKRNPSYPPLAQVGFQLQNFAGSVQGGDQDGAMLDTFRQMTNLTMEPLRLDEAESKFDLIISALQNSKALSGYIEYNTDLFDESTIARMVEHWEVAMLSMLEQSDARIENIALESLENLRKQCAVKDDEQFLPLTTTQIAFMRDIQLRPHTRQYAIGLNFPMPFAVDVEILKQAIHAVSMQNATLRARFVSCDLPWADPFYQIIQSEDVVPVDVVRLHPEADPEQQVTRYFEAQCYRQHDVFRDPLTRYHIITMGADRYWLLLSTHHLVLDGIGGIAYLQKIIDQYRALTETGSRLELEDHFADFIIQEREEIDCNDTLTFWRQQAANVAPLDFSIPRARMQSDAYQIISLRVGDHVWSEIKTHCRRMKVHPSVFFRLVSALMLKQYCRPEGDFVLNDIQSGRKPGHEADIGVFYQQVPYVIPLESLADTKTAAEFFSQQRDYRRAIKDHTQISLSAQNQILPVGRIAFQFNYFNFLRSIEVGGIESFPVTFSSHVDNTVQIFVKDFGEDLAVELWFDGAVFVPLEFLQRFVEVSRQLVSSPTLQLGELEYCLPAENRLASQWNQVGVDQAEQTYGSIVEWFEASVVRNPDNVAVVCGDEQLNYRQLNEKSNQLARYLRAQGLEAGQKVGICVSRSPLMLVAVWAALKAGATYIPIESNYPQDRISYILEDAQARMVLTEACLLERIQASDAKTILLDKIEAVLQVCDAANLPDKPASTDGIYIIYTSGSTGKPKGAVLTHGGEVNLQQWYTAACAFEESDRSIIVSAFGFDLTQKNLFAVLLCGGSVVIPRMDEYDAEIVADEIFRNHATHINCAPSAFYALAEHCDEFRVNQLKTLRWVYLGGEPIRMNALQQWLRHSDCRAKIVNSYGPTECTDVVSWYVVEGSQLTGSVPIGRPVNNTQLYIVNDALKPVPHGVPGEICVAGAGVGLGYLNREELTASAFVENPFGTGRLYRTGDLGRYLPDGNIEYIGRKDFQVKVRGLRIELGEIEHAIKQVPSITDALVTVKQDRLVAYSVSANSNAAAEWQLLLRAALPEYMVPSRLILLQAWPLTPNGKIDRKALPDPEVQQRIVPYVAPRDDTEVIIADIWAQVLRRDQIGIHDSFFDLGGHSLLANQIVSRLRKQFKVALPIRDLMTYPTIVELAQRLRKAQQNSQLKAIEPCDRSARIPLSIPQQRLWVLDRIEPGNAAYHVPSIVRINGNLDADLLESAFSAVINRHEGLRVIFSEDDAGPHQVLQPEQQWAMDGYRFESAASDEQLKRMVAADIMRPFNLAKGPMFRARLIEVEPACFVLVVVLHHIVTDGWSNGILVRELAQAYAQLKSGAALQFQPLTLQYPDFAAWQRQHLSETNLADKQHYWREALAGIPTLELPTDYRRPAVQTFRGASTSIELAADTVDKLQVLGNSNQSTLFMVLLGAYATLLQKYSGQDDFAVGTPVSGRDRPELENIVGFFVNTVALRVNPVSNFSFRQLLDQVKDTALAGFDHQEVPFEQIVEEVNPARDMSRSPLFQVMLVFQNLPQDTDAGIDETRIGDVSLAPFSLDIESAKFEQTLTLWPQAGKLAGSLTYNTDLFEAETASQFARHFERLCDAIAQDPDLALYQYDVLTPAEKRRQLVEWNQTARPYDQEQSVHGWVADTAHRFPDHTAIQCGTQSLSHAELDQLSSSVALQLRQKGVAGGSLVGIALDRNLHLMTAILGVIKAGATYVPVDTSYPQERIRYILEQAGIRVVITQSHLVETLPQEADTVLIEQLTAAAIEPGALQEMSRVDPLSWLYVIFTSGSTGKPKGTGAYHRSEVNLLEWYTSEFDMRPDDRMLLLSAVGFDLTQKNLFAPLVAGARLVIPDFQEYDAGKIIALIEKEKITWLNCAPSAFYALAETPDDWSRIASLRYVFLGGEPINLARLAGWLEQTSCQLVNSYGPTECADIAAFHRIDLRQDINAVALPIGRPNYNVNVYVLGDHQEPLPIGAIGELYIGGDGVGPGYLNNPELTQSVFIQNPLSPTQLLLDLPLLYRSGDRVRYRKNGVIEYLGRRDHQLKLRGYRIEAGEIQTIINQEPAVRDSLVDAITSDQGVQRLAAWVVRRSAAGTDDLVPALKQRAAAYLPAFMVPELWCVLDSFPLTPNGKIDRKALPKPDALAQSEYVAPRTPVELKLSELWSAVLGVQRISIRDNFFELGGQSLLATQLVSRASRQMQRQLTVRMLFDNPTIEAFALAVEMGGQEAQRAPLKVRQQFSPAKLSYGQQRLWFFEQMHAGSGANNMPVALRLRGTLNVVALEQAFQDLIRRHESLRTLFSADQSGEPVQVILHEMPWQLLQIDISALAQGERQNALNAEIDRNRNAAFDLQQGPLIRATLVQTEQTPEFYLLFCMHHIVSDGASMVVLFRELITAYLAFANAMPSPLPDLRLQYADFAEWQREWLSAEKLEAQLQYWMTKLDRAPVLLELPLDKPRPPVQATAGASVKFQMPDSFGAQLKGYCAGQGLTPFMFMLGAWTILLARYSGKQDICIGVPTLGRPLPELETMIGFFIQSLVLRTELQDNPSVQQLLQRIRQTVLDGFNNNDVPVDLIVERLGVRRNPAYSPLVQVAFQLQDDAGLNASELLQSGQFGDLEVEMLGANTATAKFDLTLSLSQSGNAFGGTLEYSSALFVESTIEHMLQHFQFICQQMLDTADRPCDRLDLAPPDQLLHDLALDSQSFEAAWPLSAMQYDMFMDNMVNPASLQSSHGWHIHIHRQLDISLWQQCIQAITAQQPILRARFVTGNRPWLDMGYLAIQKQKTVDVQQLDFTASSISDAELETVIRSLIYRPYDLLNDDLISYAVIKLAQDHHVVVTAVHHAVLDGASLNVLWEQITTLYTQRLQTPASELSVPISVLYDEFVAHDRTVMDTAPVITFWRDKFAAVEPLDFTVPAPVPAASHFITRELFLDDAHWQQLKRFCREHRITPALYLKSLFALMIQTYCRPDSDFAIQETMGGRIKGHQSALGCYIQEIPFVMQKSVLAPHCSFADVLSYARQFQKEIKEQRLISIGKQLELSPRGRVGFMFNYYQFLLDMNFLGEAFNAEGTPSDPAANVQFVVTEVGGKLKFNLFYHAHLFADFGFLSRIESLSKQIVAAEVKTLGELQWVTEKAERNVLVHHWNDNATPFDLSLCIHQRFEQQAELHPDRVAVADDGVSYTYQELNQRANQLAHFLRRMDVDRNHLVGLCAERSARFLVGILGIMKAGAAYVPMDPKYPQDRIEYMLENSEVAVLLTEEALLDKVGSIGVAARVCLDRDWSQVEQEPAHNLQINQSSRDRAYMIYTSGSTGMPKGAIIRHDGAINHIEAERQALKFDAEFSFLQTAPASSDISVWQFVGPVTCGGKVVILDDVTHAGKLFALVKEHQLSVVELVPVALQLLMEFVRTLAPEARSLPSLRWMMATGEAVSVDLVNDWLALYPAIPVVNAYGPTEAADDVIQCSIDVALPRGRKSVPIGKPLANLDVFIVDEQMRLVPPGVAGEICIGGIGVGEGYWKNPDKTAAAFVVNPFPDTKGKVLYRTGDLGRWLADGSVEYLDRVDNQVKVRGFRIELGEVESALSALPGVRENVVIVRHDLPGGAALAAYVVTSDHAKALDVVQLRAQLRERLPDFMVPAAITILTRMPLTPAGKIDRKALPKPQAIQLSGGEYIAPRTELEARLARIWESFLPVERVSIRDNFFELGGHSLIGVRIMARINQECGTQLQVASILTSQTVEALAERIEKGSAVGESLLVPITQSQHPTLFLIHPVGGDVLCYSDLAQSLKTRFSVAGLRSRGLSGKDEPFTSLQEMVQHYTSAIQTVQPEGPYYIGGQSLGGILALAVAKQLENSGATVTDVLLLDTFSPAHLREAFPDEAAILSAALGRAVPGISAESTDKSADYAEQLYRTGIAAGAIPADVPKAVFAAIFKVSITNHRLASQYEVETIRANVHHFTAQDNPVPVKSGSTWLGSAINMEYHRVPGGHEGLMQGANADGLARKIENILTPDNKNN